MNKLVLCLFVVSCGAPVAAGGLSNPYERPPLIQPAECFHLGFIPCHDHFEYDEPEGDTPEREKPEPERPCKLGYTPEETDC